MYCLLIRQAERIAFDDSCDIADNFQGVLFVQVAVCIDVAQQLALIAQDQICVHHAVSCHGDGVRNVHAVVHVDVAVVQLNGCREDVILCRNMCDAAARKHTGRKCC